MHVPADNVVAHEFDRTTFYGTFKNNEWSPIVITDPELRTPLVTADFGTFESEATGLTRPVCHFRVLLKRQWKCTCDLTCALCPLEKPTSDHVPPATDYVTNYILVVFFLLLLNTSALLIDPHDLSSRMGIHLTLILTFAAFKITTAQDLPKVSYLTW